MTPKEPTVEDWEELLEWDEMMYPQEEALEEDPFNERGQVDENEEYRPSSSSSYGPCGHSVEEPELDRSEEDENFPD